MNHSGRKHDDQSLQALAGRFPALQAAKMAWFHEPAQTSDQAPTPVLLAEFHGERVDDVRTLRSDVSAALAELGSPAEVELVRAGWLPLGGDGQVIVTEIAARHAAALEAKKRTMIENGSFATLPESAKDSFRYFGTMSKIRTPCEITYPECITVGNWVSFGRYGKIVMLPEKAFGGACGKLARQQYPELAHTFDFTDWDKDRPADLYFGDGTTIGDRYFIICTQSIEFGKHVMTASDLFVSDCHHIFEDVELPPVLLPPTKGRPVSIGDHVWIGIRCSILEGVTIGRHSVVAAHSVVKDDVPPYALAAGTPAKIRRHFAPPSNS
jgi:acetyltransferase-like isoleucine patch superfamily enzyme